LDELEQAILEFESQIIQHFEIRFRDLLSLLIAEKARNGLAQRPETVVEALEIFPDRAPTITFGNVSMNRVGGRDLLGSDALEFIGKPPAG
jgi:hypothetical protein